MGVNGLLVNIKCYIFSLIAQHVCCFFEMLEHRCSSPFLGLEPTGSQTTQVSNKWELTWQHQTFPATDHHHPLTAWRKKQQVIQTHYVSMLRLSQTQKLPNCNSNSQPCVPKWHLSRHRQTIKTDMSSGLHSITNNVDSKPNSFMHLMLTVLVISFTSRNISIYLY